MRFIKVFVSIIIVVMIIPSCDKCKYLECATNNIPGKFKIVSASTGRDLVFGASNVYNKDQIKFYAVKGIDTTYYSSFSGSQGYRLDSAIFVSFFPKSDVVYMRLSSNDVDTFYITYSSSQSKCCGVFDNINSLKHNNMNIPVSDELMELRK